MTGPAGSAPVLQAETHGFRCGLPGIGLLRWVKPGGRADRSGRAGIFARNSDHVRGTLKKRYGAIHRTLAPGEKKGNKQNWFERPLGPVYHSDQYETLPFGAHPPSFYLGRAGSRTLAPGDVYCIRHKPDPQGRARPRFTRAGQGAGRLRQGKGIRSAPSAPWPSGSGPPGLLPVWFYSSG
jgi:hypothetical protein